MTDRPDETPAVPESPAPAAPASAPPSRPWRRVAFAAAGILALAGIGAGVVVASEGPRGLFLHASAGERGGRMADFMEWRLERALDDIGASEEQVARIRAIAQAARADIAPRLEGLRGVGEEARALLSAPTIDRAAAERLRAERFAALDDASRRALEAMVEAAEALTPEQRAALAERLAERRGFGRR